jgi:hypothetical protein
MREEGGAMKRLLVGLLLIALGDDLFLHLGDDPRVVA